MAKHEAEGRKAPSAAAQPPRVEGTEPGAPMAAGKEPTGSKNFPRSKPPRAGPEETRAEEERAHSAPAAPTWLHSGSLPPAGRSLASPPLPLPCPGKGSAERRTERSCARGRCPSCGRRTSPRPRAAAPSAGPDEPLARARVAAALARRAQRQSARAASAALPARPARALPVRLLLPPAPGAARPPGGASGRDRPVGRSLQVREEQPGDARLRLPAQTTPARSPLGLANRQL